MNDLQIFTNSEFGQVRTSEIEGKTYFAASDVAKSLGYAIPHKAVRDHCRGVLKWNIPTTSGEQELLFIPEGDVYRLIISSKLPSAEKFEHWVFDEVIPSIRKHGGYISGQETLSDDELLAKALQVAQRKLSERDKQVKQLETSVARQAQIIGELKPKADYTDRILQSKGLLTTTQIAKDYGMSGGKLNKILHEMKVQYKQNGQWLLYSNYQGCGYTHSQTIDITRKDGRPDTTMQTKWTQKGRLFLYNKLKRKGILPMIEQ